MVTSPTCFSVTILAASSLVRSPLYSTGMPTRRVKASGTICRVSGVGGPWMTSWPSCLAAATSAFQRASQSLGAPAADAVPGAAPAAGGGAVAGLGAAVDWQAASSPTPPTPSERRKARRLSSDRRRRSVVSMVYSPRGSRPPPAARAPQRRQHDCPPVRGGLIDSIFPLYWRLPVSASFVLTVATGIC